MRLEIVPFSAEHVPCAAEMEKRCFSCPWSENMLAEELSNPLAVYFAAETDGVLAGYAGMQTVCDEGYITNIAVDPPFRRLGIASELLGALINSGRAKGLSFLTLEVRAGNAAAMSLYRKFGFAPCGIRRNYYEKPREDAVLMILNL